MLPAKQYAFLDVGAGDGRLSFLMLETNAKKGAAVEVAVNHKAWTYVCERYKNFVLYEGLLQDVVPRLGEQKFDVIVLAEVFEHIPQRDVESLLQVLHGLLTADGILLVTTPNALVQGRAEDSPLWHERFPYGHYKHYRAVELAQLLSGSGFEVKHMVFECHWLKKLLYDCCFYPISRLDGRIMATVKLSSSVKTIYQWVSLPFILGLRLYFYGVAQLLYLIELSCSSEKTSATIIIAAGKEKFCDTDASSAT
jgi:SAM-dependent methyltransferase